MSTRSVLRCTFAFFAALLLSVSANAQLFRAYLAPTGVDTNPCTLPAPCRLLPAALAAVADGGEIWMLDSANYNTATVTISKSVSILAVPGAVGSVLAIGGSAISITAANLNVALRNLVIVPLAGGGGSSAVNMTGASTLFIENGLIANMPSDAVLVMGGGKLKIANTIIRNNVGLAVYVGQAASADISGTQMLANAYGGVYAYGAPSSMTSVTVSDSVISGGNFGVRAFSNQGAAGARVFVTRCTISGATNGLQSDTNGVGTTLITVNGSTIVNNAYGWYQFGTGSVIESSGNNLFRGNTNTFGSLTPVGLQ